MVQRGDKHETSSNGKPKEIDLLDYLSVIVERRKTIFWIVGATFVVTTILMFLVLPRWYKSTASIMPPKQKGQFSVSSVLRNIVPLGGLGLSKASDEMFNYVAILESRSCLEEIVRRFDLVNRYKDKNAEEAAKDLLSNSEFQLSKDEVVLDITVYDTDSLVAADMANSFVDVLNRLYLQMNTQEARSNREFLQTRYDQNIADLSHAEESLRDFQKQYSVYSIPEQIKAQIQAAAQIKTQVILKEIESGVLHKTSGENDPRILGLRIELTELNKKLRELKYGGDSVAGRGDIFSPFEKTPELGMQFFRRYREVEIQQKLLEVLFPLLEQAKIEERRDTPTILVLDKAVPAYKPTKPRRLIVIFVVTLSALLVAVFTVFLLNNFKRIADEMQADPEEKMRQLRGQLTWRTFFYFDRWKSRSKRVEV